MSSSCYYGGSGDCLVLAAAALSMDIARGRTVEEIELMAAFFTILGDNLALIALTVPGDEDAGS